MGMETKNQIGQTKGQGKDQGTDQVVIDIQDMTTEFRMTVIQMIAIHQTDIPQEDQEIDIQTTIDTQ